MSVRSQALVPLSTEQQAAWRAVAETEKRRHQGNTLAEYPYAGAFFRCLMRIFMKGDHSITSIEIG